MAQTVVKDAQLRLDPIISQDVKIENTEPSLNLRETDQALAAGLWRVLLFDDELRFQKNKAVAGDFGTLESRLIIGNNFSIFTGQVLIQDGGTREPHLGFSNAAVAATVQSDNALFRSSVDNRIHWKDDSSVDQTIQFHTDRVVRETPTGALNGVNTTYTLANTPVSGTEEVYLNGVLQEPGASDDYQISGLTITYNVAPISTDRLRVSYLKV